MKKYPPEICSRFSVWVGATHHGGTTVEVPVAIDRLATFPLYAVTRGASQCAPTCD